MRPAAAPRLDDRLLRLIADAPAAASAAEVTREVGARANGLGLPRPSYEQVRVLLHVARARREEVTLRDILIDINSQARPATDLAIWIDGDRLPYRHGAKNEPRRRS